MPGTGEQLPGILPFLGYFLFFPLSPAYQIYPCRDTARQQKNTKAKYCPLCSFFLLRTFSFSVALPLPIISA